MTGLRFAWPEPAAHQRSAGGTARCRGYRAGSRSLPGTGARHQCQRRHAPAAAPSPRSTTHPRERRARDHRRRPSSRRTPATSSPGRAAWAEEGFAPLLRAWRIRADGLGSDAAIRLPDGPVEGPNRRRRRAPVRSSSTSEAARAASPSGSTSGWTRLARRDGTFPIAPSFDRRHAARRRRRRVDRGPHRGTRASRPRLRGRRVRALGDRPGSARRRHRAASDDHPVLLGVERAGRRHGRDRAAVAAVPLRERRPDLPGTHELPVLVLEHHLPRPRAVLRRAPLSPRPARSPDSTRTTAE